MINKTNAMRILDQKKLKYEVLDYTFSNAVNAVEVAKSLNEDPKLVYKTLVTTSKSKTNYVFVIPAEKELDLKKAAICTNEKYIEMITQKELLPLTGYIHGGCSPIGMKKAFLTFIDQSATSLDYIYVSGGKVGYQVKITPDDIFKVVRGSYQDLVLDK